MLIEFTVTNYRSILERQTLKMTASSYFKELETDNTFTPVSDESVPSPVGTNRKAFRTIDDE